MNVYIEPTSGTSIGIGRTQINQAIQSVLTNFVGSSPPTAANFTINGTATTPLEGTLYRSTTNKALYIVESATSKSATLGSFTRIGIGNRVEANNTALTSNSASYEVGELVMVLNTTAADSRLYMCVDNSAGLSRFADVSRLSGFVVGQAGNISFSGITTSTPTVFATSNVGVNTGSNYPTRTLDVRGDANVSTNIYVGNYIYKVNDTQGYFGFSASNTFTVATQNQSRLVVDPQGNLSIGIASSNAKMHVAGNAYFRDSVYFNTGLTSNATIALGTNKLLACGPTGAESTKFYSDGTNGWLRQESGDIKNILVSDTNWSVTNSTGANYLVFNSATAGLSVSGSIYCNGEITAFSDERLKTNIKTIDKALDKVTSLRGVYYDKDNKPSVGVIAQEVEKVMPEVVANSGDYKSVAYGNLVGLLIEAIKELKEEVTDLRGKIDVTR